MKDWNKQGYSNWKENQKTRAFEIERIDYFENREIKIYKDKLNKELDYNTQDLIGGISEFHENLRKLGVEENITIQEAVERQEQKKGIPPGQIQNFSYAATMNKIKETKLSNEYAGKERERRNRKLKVDQLRIQETLDSQKREEMLLSKLMAKQTQEQKKSYEVWRANKCKKIVIENRNKQAYQKHEDSLKQTALIEKELREAAEAIQGEREREYGVTKAEFKASKREEKMKKRRVNVEIASELVDLIMDVFQESHNAQINHKEDMEDGFLPKDTWRNWMDIFTEGKKVSEASIVFQKDDGE